MIYYMDTITLTEIFTKEHSPEEILDCDFIILSSRIIRSKKDKNVFKCNLFNERLLFQLETDDEYNRNCIQQQLLSCDEYRQLCLFMDEIKKSIVYKKVIIILCSPNEFRTGFVRYLAEVLERIFEYPIINYKLDREKNFYYDPVVVTKRIKKIEKELTRQLIKNSDMHKNLYIERLSKKDMIKECKKMGLYVSSMTKEDMKDTLQLYL